MAIGTSAWTTPPGLARPTALPGGRRGATLPAGWPMYALLLGFPLWWVLGISAFVWPMFALPMAFWLFRQPTIKVPRGFTIWAAFLFWMAWSAVRLDTSDKYVHFAYRASLYVAATIVLLYLFNMSRTSLPASRVVTVLAIFWMFVVVGGFLGVLLPNASFTSPFERVLPGRWANNEFVHDLVHPAFAQIQDVLGYEAPRPKAPFTYATNWGAAFGLLTPFVLLSWRYARTGVWRTITALMFVAALVPVVSSLDRGLWLSLGVGLVYAAVRFAMAGRGRALRSVVIVIVAVLGVVYLTPLRGLVEERFAHPHSNERRISLYQESIDLVLQSPFLGYGSPQESTINPNAPPVGTQGQFWQVLVSHGIPAALLFVAWFAYRFWRMRGARTDLELWCHTIVLIGLVQAPFYDWLGAPLVIVMIAIAIAARDANGVANDPEARTRGVERPRLSSPRTTLPPAGGRYGGLLIEGTAP
jgi:hypothetical protein